MHIACKKAFARNKDETDPEKIKEMIARGEKRRNRKKIIKIIFLSIF
jgi:hypothetical protein